MAGDIEAKEKKYRKTPLIIVHLRREGFISLCILLLKYSYKTNNPHKAVERYIP